MNTPEVGSLAPEDGRRDAIHVALAPVVAKRKLYPGDDVDADGNTTGKLVGIVDPYLKRPVREGDRFWLFLYPQTATSLRHQWTHPDFPEEKGAVPTTEAALKSVEWLEEFAGRYGFTYDRIIEAAKNYLENGDYLRGGDELEGEYVPDEFWDHYQAATGTVVLRKEQGNFFTCSC